jgi:outer membrane protein assembly factor BamB
VSASASLVLFLATASVAAAGATGLPIEWSPGKNVTWRQPVPGAGWSSPVVSRGGVFLTSGITASAGNPALHLLCFDAATGRMAWNTEVFEPASAPPRPGHEKALPANATPVVDGEHVYVYFGHHGAACLDRSGRIVWRNPRQRFDPVPPNAGSPAVVGDRFIYLADGSTAPAIVALDKHTGRTLWRVPRTLPAKVRFSFATPLAIEVAGRTQVIVPVDGAVAALDPRDGRELWRVRHSEKYAVMPRPVFAHGLLHVSAGYNRGELRAIRPDGAGDVTDTHVAWRTIKGAPITAALVVDGDALYAVNDAGVATCWEAATGRVRWQERLPGNYAAAVVAAGGRVYFQNEAGVVTVVQAGPKFVVVARNNLREPTLASYAVGDGALFVRTAAHLHRIEAAVDR